MSYFVSNIAALKAIAPSARTDGSLIFVDSLGTGDRSMPYIFDSVSTATELSTVIVLPDDNPAAGRWLITAGGLVVHRDTFLPTSAPPFKGIVWEAELGSNTTTNPLRLTRFISVDTGAASDWVPFGNAPVYAEEDPTANWDPDYVGQRVITPVFGGFFASGNSSFDWISMTGTGGGGS